MEMSTSLPALSTNDKYRMYEQAVQNPEYDLDFIDEEYAKIYGHKATCLREDFSGTALLSTCWVKRRKENEAYAIDIDPVPQDYGKRQHWKKLKKDQQSRMHYLLQDVMQSESIKADIILATNFSYFFFKKREELKAYFQSVRNSLNKDGFFMLDIFGGTQCYDLIEDKNDCGEFVYHWDLQKFNPVTSECLYKIHFRPKGQRKIWKDVFVYDWRMWSLAEVRELLLEANFSRVEVYWEGDDGEGSGNGIFTQVQDASNCESWVSYVLALP